MPDIDMSPRPTAETSSGLRPILRFSMVCLYFRLPMAGKRGLSLISEQIEVFAVFPVAHFEVEAGDLGFLDRAVVVDELLTKAAFQASIAFQGDERFAQGAGEKIRLRLVGRVGAGRQCELAIDAVEPRVDLRSEVEVGIRRRLADAVLDARSRVARPADDAQHGAAVLLAPGDAVGRERIGTVSLITVDRWRAERARCPCVRKEAGEVLLSGLGQILFLRHKGVDAIFSQ